MARTALQKIQLNGPHLAADVFLHRMLQHPGRTGCNLVSEGIQSAGTAVAALPRRLVQTAVLAEHAAGAVADSLGYRHHDAAVRFQLRPDILNEAREVEGNLGEVNQIGHPGILVLGQSRRCREPACISAHELHDNDVGCIINHQLPLQLRHGGRDVLGRRAEAGTVINAEEIVVDGLRCADHLNVRDAPCTNEL